MCPVDSSRLAIILARTRALLTVLSPGARSEAVMATNRLAAGVFAWSITAVSAAHGGSLIFPHWSALIGGWTLGAAAILAGTLTIRRASTRRRVIAMAMDLGGATYMLSHTGAAGAYIWPVYLWVFIGNGLRFGQQAVVVCMALRLVGFVTVAATTPYWGGQPPLVAGLLCSLVVVPLYARALTRQVERARRHAERASQVKDQFMAKMAHEHRTPLSGITGITGMLELLRGTSLNPEQRGMISAAAVAAQQLLDK